MKNILNKILYGCCITKSAAIKEIGISRNAFYSDRIEYDNNVYEFIEHHKNDWVFTSEKLKIAIVESKCTQKEIAEFIGVHFVTLTMFLKNKLRPTRKTGDYDKIKIFCNTKKNIITINKNGWQYSREKLQKAIDKSRKSIQRICEQIKMNEKTLNSFLEGRKIPSKLSGDYDKVRLFCRIWMEF